MNKLIVAYGSNLNLEQMAARCPASQIKDQGVLHNYKLEFRGGCGGVLNIARSAGDEVPVLVWEVPPMDEAALDSYEGFPFFYTKKQIHVDTPDGDVFAWVYVMNPGPRLARPTTDYLRTVLAGYATAGFGRAALYEALRHSVVNSGRRK